MSFVALNSVRSKARDTKRIADIRQWQSALEMYKNDHNRYPQYATSGNPLVGTNGQTYMQKVPVSPNKADGSCTTDTYTFSGNSLGTTYGINYCLGAVVQNIASTNCTAVAGNICYQPPVCGNGILETGEICDSLLSGVCQAYSEYYPTGYVGNGTDCLVSSGVCNNTCNSCRTLPQCDDN